MAELFQAVIEDIDVCLASTLCELDAQRLVVQLRFSGVEGYQLLESTTAVWCAPEDVIVGRPSPQPKHCQPRQWPSGPAAFRRLVGAIAVLADLAQ